MYCTSQELYKLLVESALATVGQSNAVQTKNIETYRIRLMLKLASSTSLLSLN